MSKSQEIKSWLLGEIKRGAFDKDNPLPAPLVCRGTA